MAASNLDRLKIRLNKNDKNKPAVTSGDVICHAFHFSGAAVVLSVAGVSFNMLRNFAGGVLYVLALYFCATFGAIFLMGPSLPLLWLRPRWFRWINDRLIMSWLLLPPVS